MTDRQEFVKAAMHGIISGLQTVTSSSYVSDASLERVASIAVKLADATMAEELNTRPKCPVNIAYQPTE